MDTDHCTSPHSADLSQADRRVLRLMRLLTHVNAGAVLALCFWLAWSAWQAGEHYQGGDRSRPVAGLSLHKPHAVCRHQLKDNSILSRRASITHVYCVTNTGAEPSASLALAAA